MTSPGQAAELAAMPIGEVALYAGLARARPSAWLEGDRLRWRLLDPSHDVDPTGLLDRFWRIADRDDVLRFAHDFGALALCKHGWPASHRPPPLSMPSSGTVAMPAKRNAWCHASGLPNVAERVTRWLDYAEQTGALISLAGHLLEGRSLKRAEEHALWMTLFRPNASGVVSDHVDGLTRSRRRGIDQLTAQVNSWLMIGNARPALIWRADEDEDRTDPAFELRADGTFGLIALQLATAVARADVIFICDGCHMAYPRGERPPQAGRRNYCPACKGKIANRDRKRRSRSL